MAESLVANVLYSALLTIDVAAATQNVAPKNIPSHKPSNKGSLNYLKGWNNIAVHEMDSH